MNQTVKVFLLFYLLFFTYLNGFTKEPIRKFNLKEEFEKAEAFLNSFKNDSANIILTRIIEDLTDIDSMNTPFGLEVQLRQADALERDSKDESAIKLLLHVVEAGKIRKQWKTIAHANLSLARLYEKMERKDDCLIYLKEAYYYIKKYDLGAVYPRYAIRNSSYHRIFNNTDSSIFYAKEVLRTAPEYKLIQEEATGHLLMGMLIRDSSYEEARDHFLAAGSTWEKSEDYSGYSAILNNLTRLNLKYDKLDLALAYNDSSLIAAQKAEDIGHEAPWKFYSSYKNRSTIYERMGQLDSALFYYQLGSTIELGYAKESNNDKVIAIEQRYNKEKQGQKIKEQAQLIQYEKDRKLWLWAIISVGLLGLILLIYYYFKLRKANFKTLIQAKEISNANEELSISLHHQMMLQGEVHHRVKNNLQIIISLLELQSEDIDDPKALKSLQTMSNRIYSMAAIHEMLYQKEGTQVINLLDYAEALCNHFKNFASQQNKPVFNIQIEEQYFNLETLMPLGIILNELVTNSLKYATGISRQLKIDIKLLSQVDGFCISYRDNGPGFPVGVLQKRDGGLGSYLLNSMSRQLNGRMESMNDGGAVFNIFFKEKNKILKDG